MLPCRSVFLCNSWLAVAEGDGRIERVLPVAGTENVTEFKNRFSDLMRVNLTDGHLWYSMLARYVYTCVLVTQNILKHDMQ